MGKGKLRCNPDKKQNGYGNWCQYAEISNNKLICEMGYGDTSICKGNMHNCIKVKYRKLASRSDKQKIEDNG